MAKKIETDRVYIPNLSSRKHEIYDNSFPALYIQNDVSNKNIKFQVYNGTTAINCADIDGTEGNVSFPYKSGASGAMTYGLQVMTSTITKIPFHSTRLYDNQLEASTSGDFTCDEAGVYLCSAHVQWQSVQQAKNYWLLLYLENTEKARTQYQTPLEELLFCQTLTSSVYVGAGQILSFRLITDHIYNTAGISAYPNSNISFVKVA